MALKSFRKIISKQYRLAVPILFWKYRFSLRSNPPQYLRSYTDLLPNLTAYNAPKKNNNFFEHHNPSAIFRHRLITRQTRLLRRILHS